MLEHFCLKLIIKLLSLNLMIVFGYTIIFDPLTLRKQPKPF